MEYRSYEIKENQLLSGGIRKLVIAGDFSFVETPGRLAVIQKDEMIHPLPIADWSGEELILFYENDAALSDLKAGDAVSLAVTGCGFSLDRAGAFPMLIGYDIWAAPLFVLAKMLLEKGRPVTALLGFPTADRVLFKEELESMGAEVYLATDDGSAGMQGSIAEVLEYVDSCSYAYVAGPMSFLKEINSISSSGGEYHMMEKILKSGQAGTCPVKGLFQTKDLYLNGPVLDRCDIMWDEE